MPLGPEWMSNSHMKTNFIVVRQTQLAWPQCFTLDCGTRDYIGAQCTGCRQTSAQESVQILAEMGGEQHLCHMDQSGPLWTSRHENYELALRKQDCSTLTKLKQLQM